MFKRSEELHAWFCVAKYGYYGGCFRIPAISSCDRVRVADFMYGAALSPPGEPIWLAHAQYRLREYLTRNLNPLRPEQIYAVEGNVDKVGPSDLPPDFHIDGLVRNALFIFILCFSSWCLCFPSCLSIA